MNRFEHVFVDLAHAVTAQLSAWGLPAWVAIAAALLMPALATIVVFPAFFAFLTWLERKVLSRIQNRIGPNRVGPFGLLQPVADGMKMLGKEDIVPRAADKLLHTLAPILIVVPALTLFALLPMSSGMIAANIDVSVMLFFAISSTSTLGLFLAGWGSRNKYSMLGAMRAVAQMISYELPVVMNAVPAVMIAGTLSVAGVVEAQRAPAGEGLFPSISSWFVFTPWGFVALLAFFIAGMAELNRSPFDIAEGESEIVAGFHTEYSGFKFALFFLGEYLAAIAFSIMAATLYLGGYLGPAFLPGWIWLFAKVMGLLGLMMWIRGTFPRLRADQLMAFCWKFLLPLGFVNIVVTATWYVLPRTTFVERAIAFVGAALVLAATYVVLVRVNSHRVGAPRTYRYATFDAPPSGSAGANPVPTPGGAA